MSDTRAHLLTRKRDLFAAIRMLEQDHEEGAIDDEAYRSARRRYESEAADILERIDTLPPEEGETGAPVRPAPLPLRWRSPKLLMALASAVVVVAVTLLLVTAIRGRTGNDAGTTAVAQTAPTPGQQASPGVRRAERAVQKNPRSAAALINLGNAYVEAGQAAAADQSYIAALKVDPSNAQATTLHAMMLGSAGRNREAIALLRHVERAQPRFARAWLLEGLLWSHTPHGYSHAIASWRHFLQLQPRGALAAEVRGFIAAAIKAERTSAGTR